MMILLLHLKLCVFGGIKVNWRKSHRSATNTGKRMVIYWYTDTHINREKLQRIGYLEKLVNRANGNIPAPQLVIGTGDNFDVFDDDWFDFYNTQSLVTVRNEIALGNHELHYATYNQLVTAFGYESNEEIAGSKFNKAFSIEYYDVRVRVILLDTNINSDGTHVYLQKGNVNSDAIQWVVSELELCLEETVLIFSHHGAHTDDDYHFDQSSGNALKEAIQNVINTKGTPLKVHHCFGHVHPVTALTQYNNFGNDYIGYLAPALRDAYYMKIEIDKYGRLSFFRIREEYIP